MIIARPGVAFEATLEQVPTGLLATDGITFSVVDPTTDTVIIAARTTGIDELDTAPGVYTTTDLIEEGGDYLVIWTVTGGGYDGEAFTEELLVGALPTVLGDVSGSSVILAVESLMRFRLRTGSFGTGQGGAQLEHFTSTTQPSIYSVTVVSNRQAGTILRDYPTAEDEDASDLVDIAALRAAIELETAAQNMDPERVRSWRDSLKDKLAMLNARLGAPGTPDDGGGRGLDAKWGFGEREDCHTPGSELAYGTKNGPLQW